MFNSCVVNSDGATICPLDVSSNYDVFGLIRHNQYCDDKLDQSTKYYENLIIIRSISIYYISYIFGILSLCYHQF